MENQEINKIRREKIFIMLASEDEKYPNKNFLMELRKDAIRYLEYQHIPSKLFGDAIIKIMEKSVDRFLEDYIINEKAWLEITSGWRSSAIYNYLQIYFEANKV